MTVLEAVQVIDVVGSMSYESSASTRAQFLRSDKATELRSQLEEMTKSPIYNTRVVSMIDMHDSYFVEKHMNYMANHLKMDHSQYIQNLRLMTKIRN